MVDIMRRLPEEETALRALARSWVILDAAIQDPAVLSHLAKHARPFARHVGNVDPKAQIAELVGALSEYRAALVGWTKDLAKAKAGGNTTTNLTEMVRVVDRWNPRYLDWSDYFAPSITFAAEMRINLRYPPWFLEGLGGAQRPKTI